MTVAHAPGPTPPNDDWAGEMGARWLANLAGFEATIAPVGEALLARAGFRPGERVIDIGCGGGATSLAIARAVAPTGTVLGVDLSAGLGGESARRAAAAGLANARFQCADAATVAPEDAPFDRLCSRFGSMFFADPVPAFTHLRRLVRPGGRIDLAVWAAPKDNPWMQQGMAVAREHLDLPLPVPRAPGPFAFAEPAYLGETLAAAGFSAVAFAPVEGELALGGAGASPAEARDFACAALAFGRMLDDAPAETRDAVRAGLLTLYAAHHRPGAGVMTGFKAWLVSALA